MKKRAKIYKRLSIALVGITLAANMPVQIFAQNNLQTSVVEQKTEDIVSISDTYIQDYKAPEGITWKTILDEGTPQVSDGFLNVTNKGDYKIIEEQSPKVQDGELEVKFQVSETNPGRFGVLFRADDKNHGGVAHDLGNSWVIYNGQGQYKTFTGPEVKAGEDVILKVTFIGNYLKVDINGETYFNDATDIIPIKEGQIGYRSWHESKTNKVDYIKYGQLGSLGGETPQIKITEVDAVNVETFVRLKPELPSKVGIKYDNGAINNVNVVWDSIDPSKYLEAGEFSVEGTVEGTDIKAIANVVVRGDGMIYNPDYSNEDNQGWKVNKGGGTVTYNGNSVTVGMNGSSLSVDEKSPNLKDFTYETDFEVSSNDGRIGLMFRHVSDNDWGAICYDSGSWIWKAYNNGAETYGSFGGSSVKLEAGKKYKLKLKVQDNNVSLWVNDEQVGSQAIPNLPNKAGKVGLHGWFGNKNVTLSNLRVEEVLPLLPPEVGEVKEQVIKSEKMSVVLDNNFPRVIRYEYDGDTLVGEDEQLYIMEINGEKYVPEVSCKTKNNVTTYKLKIPEIDVEVTLEMSVSKNKLRMEVTKIKEGNTKVKTINFPNHSLASVKNNENGKTASVLTTGDWNNIVEEFKDVKDMPEASQGKTYAFINNDEFAVTIDNNVIEGGNRAVLSTESRNGYKKTGIGNGTWTYREELKMESGEKVEEELPWSEVIITKDKNNDKQVDWQDAAIEYRNNMRIPKGGEDIKNNMSYIDFNIGYTQNPFLRSLDTVKKLSNYTDNFGQLVLHKGYQGEGHDDSHPDYGGHIGIRQGGVKDFNTLINEGEKYNAKIGVHINATEYALDAFEFPMNNSVNEKSQGWTWMDRTFYVDQRKDITSGELYRRLDMLKKDAPNLGWVYVDVYTGNGWNAHKLAEKIDELDYMFATEMNGPLEQDVVWTHWGGDPAYPNKGNASQIMRFMKNHVQDTFLANPLLKGNKHLLSGGWGTRHSIEGEYGVEVFYNQVLPTKYLQHFPVIKMNDNEVLFEEGVRSVKEGENYNFYKDDRLVATTPENTIGETGIGKTKLFLPWNPVKEDEKIYHWNPLGTTSEWELPDSWKNLKTVQLYELSDLGKTRVKEIKVTNGKVKLEVKQDTPYLVTKGKVKEERIDDWGEGSEIKDPGFDSQSFKIWKKESKSKKTDHIKIINEKAERREGNDLVEITEKDAKLSQKIKGLKEGVTYSVSAWVKNDDNREVTLKAHVGKEKVESKITRKSLVRAGEGVKFYGDTFTRMEVEFTVPKGANMTHISLEVGKGDKNSKVFVDDFRIWEHPGQTNKDGYVFYEDFENVDEGIGPFNLSQSRGTSNRTHLAEKSLDENKQQRMNWVLDGRFSLKSNQNPDESGEIMTTEEATFKLEKNKTYELGFIYSLANEDQNYTVKIKSKSQGELVNIPLKQTNVEGGKFTNTKEVLKEFTTGNTDDYYLTIEKGATKGDITELIVDNVYVKEIDKSIKSPVLKHVNLNSMTNELKRGQKMELSINALMSNGENVDLKDAKVEYNIDNKKAVKVEDGKLVGKGRGKSKVSVKVTVGKKTITSNEFVVNVK